MFSHHLPRRARLGRLIFGTAIVFLGTTGSAHAIGITQYLRNIGFLAPNEVQSSFVCTGVSTGTASVVSGGQTFTIAFDASPDTIDECVAQFGGGNQGGGNLGAAALAKAADTAVQQANPLNFGGNRGFLIKNKNNGKNRIGALGIFNRLVAAFQRERDILDERNRLIQNPFGKDKPAVERFIAQGQLVDRKNESVQSAEKALAELEQARAILEDRVQDLDRQLPELRRAVEDAKANGQDATLAELRLKRALAERREKRQKSLALVPETRAAQSELNDARGAFVEALLNPIDPENETTQKKIDRQIAAATKRVVDLQKERAEVQLEIGRISRDAVGVIGIDAFLKLTNTLDKQIIGDAAKPDSDPHGVFENARSDPDFGFDRFFDGKLRDRVPNIDLAKRRSVRPPSVDLSDVEAYLARDIGQASVAEIEAALFRTLRAQRFDVWVTTDYTGFDDDDTAGTEGDGFSVGIGGSYVVDETLTLGLTARYRNVTSDGTGQSYRGDFLGIAALGAVALPHGIELEGTVLFERGMNDLISGGSISTFGSNTFALSVEANTVLDIGSGISVSPHFGVSHAWVLREGFVDQLGTAVPASTVTQGLATLGAEVTAFYPVENSFLIGVAPSLDLSGQAEFNRNPGSNRGGGAADAGLTLVFDGDAQLSAGAGFRALGGFTSWTFSMTGSIPF